MNKCVLIEGKTVLGQPREIQKIRNAFSAYEAMTDSQANNLQDLLTAHGILMSGLTDDAGLLRRSGTGIYLRASNWCIWHRLRLNYPA